MDHHFNTEVAKLHSVGEAIVLHNICFWQKKNIANNSNFHDGKYWVYNSISAYVELFPYYSDRQIRTILKKLEDKGCVFVGRYNKMKIDRTKWYSASDEIMAIHGIKPNDIKCQMQLPKNVNAMTQNGQCNDTKRSLHLSDVSHGSARIDKPIPYKKTDKNKDNNIYSDFDFFFSSTDFVESFNDYVKMRKDMKKKLTPRSEKRILNKLVQLSDKDVLKAIALLDQSALKNWLDVFPLNNYNTGSNTNGPKSSTPSEKIEEWTY